MMSNGRTKNHSGPDLSLTPVQQDLLLTALASNRSQALPNSTTMFSDRVSNSTKPSVDRANSNLNQGQGLDATRTNTELYKSPLQESPGFGGVGSDGFEESPIIGFDPGDGSFDFWNNSAENMFGSLPGAANDEEGDLHDKRKSPEDEEDEEGGHKRREGEDKSAKKPGRKPLTGEPTTVIFHGRKRIIC